MASFALTMNHYKAMVVTTMIVTYLAKFLFPRASSFGASNRPEWPSEKATNRERNVHVLYWVAGEATGPAEGADDKVYAEGLRHGPQWHSLQGTRQKEETRQQHFGSIEMPRGGLTLPKTFANNSASEVSLGFSLFLASGRTLESMDRGFKVVYEAMSSSKRTDSVKERLTQWKRRPWRFKRRARTRWRELRKGCEIQDKV